MKYIVLLDYSTGSIIKINLSEKEQILVSQLGNVERFLTIMEKKYGFKLKNCSWMATEALQIYEYNLGVCYPDPYDECVLANL